MFGWSWPAVERHGTVVTTRREGTVPGGGPFESEHLSLALARNGRFTRIEFFEIDALDTALARFEELRPDPLRIPANLATRAQERQAALAAAGDWDAVRALHSPRLVFDDRRSGLRTTVDGEAYLAGLRWGRPGPTEVTATVLATAGDRLELRHNRFTRTEGGTLLFEVDTLALAEVDADGRLESIILFDPDDRAVAEAELFERYVAGGGDGMPRGMTEYFRGVNGGDLARARTGLCDDFVLEDRRRTGMGRLAGGDAYIASVAAAYELTGELHVRPLYTAAIAPHGRVVMIRAAGTNIEGGAFESHCAALVLYRDERIAAFEFFEPEDLDTALARLAGAGMA
jgi:ketosteroid isomerase-like protein